MRTHDLEKGVGMPLILASIAILIVVAAVVFLMMGQPTEQEAEQEEITAMVDKNTAAMMEKEEPTEDTMMKKVDDAMMKDMMAMSYQYSGELADVTEGNTIRGINTGGTASGIAKANYKEGSYDLFVTFESLPDPEGSDFYEGWVVRRGDSFSVISTGRVEKVDDSYANTYRSGMDLTDHDFYVLTLEPNDGDPAPADHIVEGTVQ